MLQLKWSFIYRLQENCQDFTLPIIMKEYLTALKGGNHTNCYIFWALATIVTFMQGLWNRRASNFKGVIMAKGGQTIRSLLYKKLCEADFMFQLNIDSGFITRIAMFEIEGILTFLVGIPVTRAGNRRWLSYSYILEDLYIFIKIN